MFALAILTIASTCSIAEDWPRWRGPERNGISREVDWNQNWSGSSPKTLWKVNVGTGFSSVVVSDGRLFTIGNTDDEDTIFCLDAETGVCLWKHTYPCPLDDRFFEGGPTSTPTVDGTRVFVLSRTGDVYSLDASKGEVLWSKNLPSELGIDVPGWGFAGSPLVLDELLILSVGQSGTALNKQTGEVVWQSEGEAGYMSPTPFTRNDAESVMIASGKAYFEIESETGRVIWRHRWLTNFGCNAADPIIQGNRLFISSGYNRGSAVLDLSEMTPKVVWESKDFQNQWSSSVLLDGHLYGVDGDDTGERFLKCLEFDTGKVLWSHAGLGSASLLVVAKSLFVLSDQGELVIAPASPAGFQPTARAQVLDGKCWTVPVLANGMLYCRSATGDVVCLDIRTPR